MKKSKILLFLLAQKETDVLITRYPIKDPTRDRPSLKSCTRTHEQFATKFLQQMIEDAKNDLLARIDAGDDLDDLYDICMWGKDPQVLKYPLKSASFNAGNFMRKAKKNAYDFFNRTKKH